jgi:hypothetical protein
VDEGDVIQPVASALTRTSSYPVTFLIAVWQSWSALGIVSEEWPKPPADVSLPPSRQRNVSEIQRVVLCFAGPIQRPGETAAMQTDSSILEVSSAAAGGAFGGHARR